MPSSVRARRGFPRLRVHSTDAVGDTDHADHPPQPPPWFAVAIGSGLLGATAGWLAVAGVVLVAWLTARAGEFRAALNGATQLWLLAHGGGLQIAGVRWTLVPLGLTILLVLLLRALATAAARRTVESEAAAGVPADEVDTARVVRRVSVVTTVSYAVVVTAVAVLAGSVGQGVRTAFGSVLLAVLAAGWGACRGADYRPADLLPDWARPLPSAIAAALWAVLCGGAAALTISLIQHRERIVAIAAGLGADPASTVQVTVAQLLFLPNLVIWAGSWTLGAGFTFGRGSVVSPPSTDLGLLPSVPVLGALPAEGPGSWSLLWMMTGVLAGAVLVAVVIRRSPRARFEEAALVSGLAGVLAALGFTGLAVAASGDLGAERLTDLGPRLGQLGVLAGALLGMSGLLIGMVAGLVRQVRRGREADWLEPDDSDQGATVPIEQRPVDDDDVTVAMGDRVDP